MRILAGAIGGIIVILVLWDVVKTTLLLQGAGPLNRRLSNSIWRGCLAVHHRLPGHFFLSVAGVCILLASVSLWILLYWIGWSLIFSMSEMAVISAQNEVPASFWQRIYYVGFTFITLGIGDFKAGSALWEIITVILSISGFFIVTLVITYLLPVVSSAVEQRQLAVHIQSMRFAQGTFFSSFQETGVWMGWSPICNPCLKKFAGWHNSISPIRFSTSCNPAIRKAPCLWHWQVSMKT